MRNMFMKLIILSVIITQSFALISSVNKLKTQLGGTIKNGDGETVDKAGCLTEWKAAWGRFLTALGTNNQNIVEFANSKRVFPGLSLGEKRLEFDGPRSDQSIQQGATGYRGVNRFVVYVTGFENNDRSKVKITHVYISNDHYGHFHEVKMGSKALTELGGVSKFKAHRAYYNDYDEYDEYDDSSEQQQQVHGHDHYYHHYRYSTNTDSEPIATAILIAGVVFAICLLLCGCIMMFGCGALTSYVFMSYNGKVINKYNRLSQTEQMSV